MPVFHKRLILILIGLSIFYIMPLWAQDTTKTLKKPRNNDILNQIDFGGYLGAQFGNVTFVLISPIASYRVTETFHAGLGLTYQYYQDNTYHPAYSSSAYGGSIFARYFIWRDLFAHVEYAPLYITNFIYYPPFTIDEGKAPWAHDVLLGGGYRQWMGEKAFINMMILWNVNESIYSPYSNPIIRIGFGVGL